MTPFNKKSISTTLLGVLVFFSASAQNANAITGKWRTAEDANRHCQIYLATDGAYYGKLIYEGGKKENIGKLLLKQLRFDERTKTYKGTMSPPDRGMEVNATISFLGNDELKIIAKKFLFSKTVSFLRIK